MRVAMSQALLRAIDALAPNERAAIRSRFSESAIAEIESNLPVAFIPMSIHMNLSDIVRDTLGPARAVPLWEEAMRTAWDRPLLRGFVSAVSTLFGLDPKSLLKQADRIHHQLTRDVGDLEYIPVSDQSGTVTLRGFPARQFRFICYIEGLQGCMRSAYALTGCDGTVTPSHIDETTGTVLYAMKWWPASESK
jgi:hypothetical protein